MARAWDSCEANRPHFNGRVLCGPRLSLVALATRGEAGAGAGRHLLDPPPLPHNYICRYVTVTSPQRLKLPRAFLTAQPPETCRIACMSRP